jgi:hypothetical protein
MQYIAENSDVPVPRVHGSWADPATQQNFVVMDFVPGETLENLLPSLQQGEKDDIAQLIKDALAKLHDVPEPGYLGSVGGQACTHGMFWSPDGPDALMPGPFEEGEAGHVGCLLVDERMKEGMGGDVWSWGAETYTNKTTSTLLYHGRRGDLRCTSVT